MLKFLTTSSPDNWSVWNRKGNEHKHMYTEKMKEMIKFKKNSTQTVIVNTLVPRVCNW
jgi:hypothetical protein